MISYSYTPIDMILETLERREKQIVEVIKSKGKISPTDLKRQVVVINKLMGHNQFDRLFKKLKEREIVIEIDSGKYQLRKEVSVERSRHSFKTDVADGKMQDSYIEWYNLDELPLDIRETLLGNSWYGYFLHCLEDKSLSQSRKEAISNLLKKMKLLSFYPQPDRKSIDIDLMDLFSPSDQKDVLKFFKK